jgi:hypothetical protein
MVSVPARFMQPVVGLRVTVLSYTDHPRPVLLLWQGHRKPLGVMARAPRRGRG